jgi:hypothetical protein
MALFNPILLIVASFVMFIMAPDIGKHLMPIALNVAFLIFFALSLKLSFTPRARQRVEAHRPSAMRNYEELPYL